MARKLFMFVVVPIGFTTMVIAATRFSGHSARWLLPFIMMSPIVVLVLLHGLSLPDDYMKRWTRSHGIEITDENGPLIRRYLLRGRRFRTIGGLLGYASPTFWNLFVRYNNLGGVSWVTVTIAGYLLGAAAAEIWAFRPAQRAVRTASLTPRRIADYVPRYAVIGIRALPIASISLAACWRLIPTDPHLRLVPGPAAQRPDPWPIVAWAAFSVVIWVVVEATARRIVRRAQPVTSELLVRTDDAIRATAMHGLMGAGLALMLGSFAHNLGEWTGFAGPDYLFKGFEALGLVCGLLALPAWLRLGFAQQWVVPRSRKREQVAA